MRSIPLNLMTLYADLLQSTRGPGDEVAGSVALKTVKKKRYYYHTIKDGSSRVERYLGPADDPATVERVATIKAAAAQAKERRATVTALKSARIASPSLVQGRVLEVLANAGLFERGMTLVGTVAYQTYPCLIGAHLPASGFATNDIDLSVAEFVAEDGEEDIEAILKRADPTFGPVWHPDDKLPRKFVSKNFQVDVVTSHRRGRRSPIPIDSLRCAAEALTFQEYPAEETVDAISLYGSGVLVRVPTPLRFAVHKLLVAQKRPKNQLAKKQKDLRQAKELIDIYLEIDEAALQDVLDDARDRGRAWKSAINASLKEIKREARQGSLPLPISTQLRRRASSEKKR